MQNQTVDQVVQEQPSSDKPDRLPPLMRKFVNDVKYHKPDADFETRQDETGSIVFTNMVTQGMWLGYMMGYKKAKNTEPGVFFLAKVTENGLEMSSTPMCNNNWTSVIRATKSCERKYGGNFIPITINKAAYEFLKKQYVGNQKVVWGGNDISKIPFVLRK